MFLFGIKISLLHTLVFLSLLQILISWFCGTDIHSTLIVACHTSKDRQEIKVLSHLSPGLGLQIGLSKQAQDLSMEANFRITVTLQPQNAEQC